MRQNSGGIFRLRLLALLSGVLGFVLAIATPLLPVRQDRVSLDWPQPQSLQLTAPLVDYAPLGLDLSIPCTVLRDLQSGTVIATVPAHAPGAADQGLIARIEDKPGSGRTLSVLLRNTPLLTASITEISGAGTISAPGLSTFPGQAPGTATGSKPSRDLSPGGDNPPTGDTQPRGDIQPGDNPAGGTTPPPGSTPPPGTTPPPGSTPPPGTTPAPGSTPSPGTTPPPGSTPPPGANPPPGTSQPGATAPSTAISPSAAPQPGAPTAESGGTPACDALVVHSTADSTTAELTGMSRQDGTPFRTVVNKDVRPQIVGVYTDLDREKLGNAHLHAEVDARFSSSPSVPKLAAIVAAVLCTLVALLCLHLLDTTDGRRSRRFLPARWWRFTVTDAIVLLTLGIWHVIGANTSDDGYILTMARVSRHAGYIANYYRWFGVAEAPFGWPDDILAQMTRVSDASLWMRLPALLCAVLCWWVISREVLPRLGARVRASGVARWTAALVFLAFWLPYDNGLRPEPFIALGALLTWCSIERAIATRRLLPAAVAVLIAAFSLAAGPSGLICVAALIAGSRTILQTAIARARRYPGRNWLSYSAMAAPILAAGVLVLVVVFADQTLAAELEATRVRQLIGPDLQWYDEAQRWESLLGMTPDGSLTRRFGVLGMLLCLGACVSVALRKGGRIPDAARGPVARVLGIVFMSLLLMMFTPTKWTHHFGVYAGLAGALAAVTAVAVGSNGIRARYNRSLFAAAVLFLLGVCFAGSGGWWYVSGYGMAWPDRAPMLAGKSVATLFLVLAGLCLLAAVCQYYREPYLKRRSGTATGPFDRFAIRPLTLAAALLVVFEVGSMAQAAYVQYPAYSVALSNIRTLAGHPCALADDVLVETNTADSLLQPYTGTAADGLAAENTGFTANGVGSLAPDAGGPGGGGGAGGGGDQQNSGPPPGGDPGGPGGTAKPEPGINGSTAMLPFGLDAKRTPVLGSSTTGDPQPARLTTQWYRLDLAAAQHDSAYRLLLLTVAGRLAGDNDPDSSGDHLRIEFAHRGDDGTVQSLGDLTPPTVGGAPAWRNLPVPLDRIPAQTNAIRIVADTAGLTGKQWLAVVPPRLPRLATLNSVVGDQDPVLTDFQVGLAFPCQHPLDHKDGVAQLPTWRILPDKLNAQASATWQDEADGGPLGWMNMLLQPHTVPAYLDHDWTRDWGELQRLTPAVAAPAAQLTVRVENRWGWAGDGLIKVK
ncbi:arabinosyltransferase domain-containing protein [Nocardia sp. NPDC020380]|uniref:arabinosyltransferase domain-containing protein n=1 Tax=Nocardia sp. NPDC020380 TaxID=3364309 RepID=UPI0037A78C76